MNPEDQDSRIGPLRDEIIRRACELCFERTLEATEALCLAVGAYRTEVIMCLSEANGMNVRA